MEICGTDAEWKRDMLSLGEVNRASSDHDGMCAMKNRENKMGRPCKKLERKYKKKRDKSDRGVWGCSGGRVWTRTVKAGYGR
jgi:hypothetical protein